MQLSKRLATMLKIIDRKDVIADIGTDHGYMTIALLEMGLCDFVIATDINFGPLKKAKTNIALNGLEDKVDLRKGSGFLPLKKGEAQGAIIAGMGGHLIKQILQEGKDIYEALDFVVAQPVQNPEALRKFLYESGCEIIEEELCYEEGKYYEIIKFCYGKDGKAYDSIYYEIGLDLVKKAHPLIGDYINYKIKRNEAILRKLNNSSKATVARREEVLKNISELEGVLQCLPPLKTL